MASLKIGMLEKIHMWAHTDGVVFMFEGLIPVSLNVYRHLLPPQVKRARRDYGTLIGSVVIASFNKEYYGLDEFGSGVAIDCVMPLFPGTYDLQWVLGFQTALLRDIPNYSQKIMLDAIVDVGLVKDDNHNYLKSEKVRFSQVYGSSFIACALGGEYDTRMLECTPRGLVDDTITALVTGAKIAPDYKIIGAKK